MFADEPVVIFACPPAPTSGIDADRYGLPLSVCGADAREGLELAFAFNVDLIDAGSDCVGELRLGFAHAGENDTRGRNAGGDGLADLAFRHRISARAKICERSQYGQIAVGLHGVEDFRSRRAQGLRKQPIVPLDGGARIAEERRTDLGGDVRQAHVLGVKDAVAIAEMMHGFGPLSGSARPE